MSDWERAYADLEAQATERWVGETLRNVTLIAAGYAQGGEMSGHYAAVEAWKCYEKLEQLVRGGAP